MTFKSTRTQSHFICLFSLFPCQCRPQCLSSSRQTNPTKIFYPFLFACPFPFLFLFPYYSSLSKSKSCYVTFFFSLSYIYILYIFVTCNSHIQNISKNWKKREKFKMYEAQSSTSHSSMPILLTMCFSNIWEFPPIYVKIIMFKKCRIQHSTFDRRTTYTEIT